MPAVTGGKPEPELNLNTASPCTMHQLPWFVALYAPMLFIEGAAVLYAVTKAFKADVMLLVLSW